MRKFFFIVLIFLAFYSADAQQFTLNKIIPHTSVKDQGNSGSCWCFATTSFIESELMRLKGFEIDLSVA